MAEADNIKRPIVNFDHESAHHAQNWAEEYSNLRKNCPLAWTEKHGGFWVATKYEDVLAIARDPVTFSSAKTFDPETGDIEGGLAIPPVPNARSVPIEMDPPEWQTYRRLINPKLGPGAVEAYRADAQKLAAALVDGFIENGRCDLVHDLTNPLPALVTLRFFGLPLDEFEKFATPLHEVYSLPRDTPEFVEAVRGLEWMHARLAEEITKRRAHPADDFIGYLAEAKIDGEPLSDQMMQEIFFNVMAGGVDTTTALTSNVLLHLAQHPEDRRRLTEDLSMLPIACEEFVRYFSPIHGFARNIKKDVTVSGCPMKAGERVFLAYAAANRDEDIFDQPEVVDIARFPNRHMGFGAGNHRCVGSFLARVMFEAMMREVLTRLPDYQIDVEDSEHYPSVAAINGWSRMPAIFTPGQKVGATLEF
jgi:cytochrome P450